MIASRIRTPQSRRARDQPDLRRCCDWLDCRHRLGPSTASEPGPLPELVHGERAFLLVAITTVVLFMSLRAHSSGVSQPLKGEARKRSLRSAGSSASTDRNLTQRRRVDATLIKSERRFRSLARNIPGVVYQLRVTSGKAYRFDYLSPKADEIFGVSPTLRAPTGRDRVRWSTPMTGPLSWIRWQTRSRGGRTGSSKVDSSGPQDGPKWFQGLSSVLEHGDELLYHGVFLDITQRKRIEEQLRSSRLPSITAPSRSSSPTAKDPLNT